MPTNSTKGHENYGDFQVKKIDIYDTTLRDGSQGEGISFSLKDKLFIAEKLDELGVQFIEGGWPGSNPKDAEFFKEVNKKSFEHAKIVAFSSTRRPFYSMDNDPNIEVLINTKTKYITIFGKTWDFHVKEALNISMVENLKMIYETVKYLKEKGHEVFFDAEHFFDGYKSNPEYALKALNEAYNAGAAVLCLCDTNGGTLPLEIKEIVSAVKVNFPKTILGIHAHNDGDFAVANSIIAVQMGCAHVQGTINGYGERCGNANLCSIIPNLELKLGYSCISGENLKIITKISRTVSEIANLVPREDMPYIGVSAFAHKGGIHVNAIRKNSRLYEHISPELVGNQQRVLVSELAGKSNIFMKARELGFMLDENSDDVKKILHKIKESDHYKGIQFEGADASFKLFLLKAAGKYKPFFDLKEFEVIVEKRDDNRLISEAIIKIVVDGKHEHIISDGNGPVNALDNALRKALLTFYPELGQMHLLDFRVRIMDQKAGTRAKTRVLIESCDKEESWWTVGVSENIIEASWEALVDSIEYKLLKEKNRKKSSKLKVQSL
ncbi:MAG: citramalate synthase [Candidatus Firestonebacteria bacterium]|nr:citramalate synthase [Candidatus Firestonebacteria bacterium]